MTNENILETVELNSAEFRALCRRAAEGDAEAQYRVGQSLVRAGESDEGREWIRKAFESGRHGAAVEVAGFLREEGKLMAAAELLESVADEIPAAKLELAMCCLKGDGVKKDPERAELLLQEIARDGDGEAKLGLARRYKYGNCVPRSFGRAMNWLGQAMEAGCDNAMERYYAEEREVEREAACRRREWESLLSGAVSGDANAFMAAVESEEDPEQQEAWCLKAAEMGCADAQLWMGKKHLCLLDDVKYIGLLKAWDKYEDAAVSAAEWYRKAAEQGNAEAQYRLGSFFYHGIGVEKDAARAVEWYTRAAEQGYEKAVRILEEPWAEVERIRKAAEQGDTEAQYSLAVRYRDGDGVRKDRTKAVEWYTKAAEQGDAEAQNWLGECYRKGIGTEANKWTATFWYGKAAEQGLAAAQYNLGYCYFHGIGVEKDGAKAVEWLCKAADQGSKGACELLGKCYETGFGVEASKSKADQWYLKAGTLSDDNKRLLERAAEEDGVAQYKLGLRYLDEEPAVGTGWLEKAAENGYKDAARKLAELAYAAKDYGKAKAWYLKYGMENAVFYVDAERGDAEAQYRYAKETKSLSAEEREKYYRMAAAQGHTEAKTWVDQEMQRLAAEMEARKKAREDEARRAQEEQAAREKANEEKARKEREEARKKKCRKALDKPLTALFVLMMIALTLLAVFALLMPRRFGYGHLGAMVAAQVVLLLCYLLSYSPPNWIVRTGAWCKFCGIVWLVVAAGMAIQLVFRSSGLTGATALRFGIALVVSLVGVIFFLRRGKKPKTETKKR